MMMTMKSCLSGPFLLLLLFLLSSTVSGSVVMKYYGHLKHHATWQDARRFCRDSNYYTDLAIIYEQSEADKMNLEGYFAWIGLHKTEYILTDNWIWSDGQSNFKNWGHNEPQDSDTCADTSYSYRKFYGTSCDVSLFFICHKRSDGSSYKYTFIPQSKTWSEARQYCRGQYDDLATIEQSTLYSAVDRQDFPVWTGLHRDGETWKWSAGLSEYRNWASDEPGNNGNCVSISSLSKKMATQNCSAKFPFICFRDNLVLVKENKTWEEALNHCRALESPYHAGIFYDLISVQPGEDHSYIMNKVMEANTEKVWTGLRFLAGHWLWVNGASLSYPDLPICPLEDQRCGALSKNGTHTVETRDCLEKRNFLCYSSL